MKKEKLMNKSIEKTINILIYCLLIPGVMLLGYLLWKNKNFNIVSMGIALLTCIPFFINFERKKYGAKELVTISVMVSISAMGRLLFALTPGFKPVTAITILTAIAFGPQVGFMTGSLSALVSNIYFGQGPWTAFQMFSWGILGYISGLMFRRNKNPNIILLILIGILGGVLFSLIMDVYSTLSLGSGFSFKRYIAIIITALPFTGIYVVSNVVFLIALYKPILKVLNRMKSKYGVFQDLDKGVNKLETEIFQEL